MPGETFEHDCTNCGGYCCIAHTIRVSDGFPVDKDLGVRCKNLTAGCRCSIFDTLEVGSGCRDYTCFGAGNAVHLLETTPGMKLYLFLKIQAIRKWRFEITEILRDEQLTISSEIRGELQELLILLEKNEDALLKGDESKVDQCNAHLIPLKKIIEGWYSIHLTQEKY